MTTEMSTDDVVVCMDSTQMMTPEPVSGCSRVASSSANVDLGRRLLLAARAGNTTQVLDLLAKGAPFTTDWLGTSPLHLAATNNHTETCAVLLRAGVSRDCRTKVERTPLHVAAYAGHADVVTLLLDHGAAVDCRDMLRMTPLHWAAQRGHTGAAQALISRGCELAPLSKFNKTPWDLATSCGHTDIVQLIQQAVQQPYPQAEMIRVTAEEPREIPISRRPRAVVREFTLPDQTTHTQGLPTIQRIQDIKPNAKTKLQQESPVKNEPENNAEQSNQFGDSRAAALLRRHGITLLPADDGSTVLNALQCGRTVVLSDAGKLMLKESSPPQPTPTDPTPTLPTPTPPTSTLPTVSPSKAYKLFTLDNKLISLDNKLLLPQKSKNNISNMQVKLVQIPDGKIVSPAKPINVKPRKGGAKPTPVKIIVNKTNYRLLPKHLKQALTDQSESTSNDDKESLRSQLQAARKAIAALTAELASCKARLALLEHKQT